MLLAPHTSNVWFEPWIPTIKGFKSRSVRDWNNNVFYVADLIDVNTNKWLEHVLANSFSQEEEVKEIVKRFLLALLLLSLSVYGIIQI